MKSTCSKILIFLISLFVFFPLVISAQDAIGSDNIGSAETYNPNKLEVDDICTNGGNAIVEAGTFCGKNDEEMCVICNICGDGYRDENTEECDDGNDENKDECRNTCETAFCGDSVIATILNETCDDGAGNSDIGNACRTDCTYCGDSNVDSVEDCDDGNTDEEDSCRKCQRPYCGDGVVDSPDPLDPTRFETCDDINDDSCRNNCTKCGDGVVDTGYEECDLASSTDPDTNGEYCNVDCSLPECGDGVVDVGEACDEGDLIDGDGCSSTCQDEIDSCGREPGDNHYGSTNCCDGIARPSKHGTVTSYGDKYSCIKGNHSLSSCDTGNNSAYDYCSSQAGNFYSAIGQSGGAKTSDGGSWGYTRYLISGSLLSHHSNGCWTCAALRIYGCFVPEAKILMSDGTLKEIDSIASGDMVKNPVTGKSMKIKSLIESYEEDPIISILTDSNTIKVTSGHPILTKSGVLLASKLKLGDLVAIGSDKYESVVKMTLLEEEKQRVVNFRLDTDSILPEDHYVLADGIVAGDLYLQEYLESNK